KQIGEIQIPRPSRRCRPIRQIGPRNGAIALRLEERLLVDIRAQCREGEHARNARSIKRQTFTDVDVNAILKLRVQIDIEQMDSVDAKRACGRTAGCKRRPRSVFVHTGSKSELTAEIQQMLI